MILPLLKKAGNVFWYGFELLYSAVPPRRRSSRGFERFCRWSILILLLLFVKITLFSAHLQLLASFGIFLLGCALAICWYSFFRRKAVILLVFFALSFWGMWVYRSDAVRQFLSGGKGDDLSIAFTTINNMASTFFPSRGDYAYDLPVRYYVYHTAVHFFFGILITALWGRRLIGSLHDLVVPESRKMIFWDPGALSEASVAFAEKLQQHAIRSGGRICKVQFCTESSAETGTLTPHCYDLAADKNLLLTEFDASRKNMDWHVAAAAHFLVTEDQDWNVRTARALIGAIRAAAARKPSGRRPEVFLKIGSGETGEILSEWADGIRDVEIVLLREYALIAQTFTAAHPMLRAPGITVDGSAGDRIAVRGNFRLLLLGFGWLGKEILKECVCDAQFPGTAFSADVVDTDPKRFERFQERCRSAVRAYGLHFHAEDVLSGTFARWLKNGFPDGENLASCNRVVVCLGDDRRNVETAAYLAGVAGELGMTADPRRWLYVYCSDAALAGCYKGRFTFFGDKESTFALILNDAIGRNARMMNYYWAWSNANLKAPDEAWNAATQFSRESSRAAVTGSRNRLRLLYADEPPEAVERKLERDDVPFSERFPDFTDRIAPRLRFLAEMEHLRWNAYHLMQGVQPLPVGELPDEPLAPGRQGRKANHLKDRNAHAALVPFAELPAVDAATNGGAPEQWEMLGLQKSDVDFCLYLPAIAEPSDAGRLRMLEKLLAKLETKGFFPDLDGRLDAYCDDCRTKIGWLRNKLSATEKTAERNG